MQKMSPSPADAMQLHGRAMAAPMTQLVDRNASSLYRRGTVLSQALHLLDALIAPNA